MVLRRVVWILLGVMALAGVLGLRAHTQHDPQCDVGFTCASVDHVAWTGVDSDVGGLCVSVGLTADLTTMFRQDAWAGFRRTASQTSDALPTHANVSIKARCTDDKPAPGGFTQAWVAYLVATDREAIDKAQVEAARALTNPTRSTLMRGKDHNWLFTVARVPTDSAVLDDAFAPNLVLAVPKHWSQELGELRLPCLWVAAQGSVEVGGRSFPIDPVPGGGPVEVCAPGRGDAWFDKLDNAFGN